MNRTLLIADGDKELCTLYSQIFAECGYEVETSSDGLDCLKKLRQVMPDALVLNLELRWGGGDGVLDWIRAESPTHTVPVILTSMTGYPHKTPPAIAPPIVAYLPKPFALTQLLESVRAAVAGKERRDLPAPPTAATYTELFIG